MVGSVESRKMGHPPTHPLRKCCGTLNRARLACPPASLFGRDAKNQYLVRGNKIAFHHPVADEHIVVCLCNDGSNLHAKAIW